MPTLRELLEQYARENPRRATGGIYSLAVFDFQLRLYLAELVDHLSSGTPTPLVEAFSDIVRPTSDDRLVMVQVKLTLNQNSLRKAADEVAVIDEFLEKHDSDLRLTTSFEVAGLAERRRIRADAECLGRVRGSGASFQLVEIRRGTRASFEMPLSAWRGRLACLLPPSPAYVPSSGSRRSRPQNELRVSWGFPEEPLRSRRAVRYLRSAKPGATPHPSRAVQAFVDQRNSRHFFAG